MKVFSCLSVWNFWRHGTYVHHPRHKGSHQLKWLLRQRVLSDASMYMLCALYRRLLFRFLFQFHFEFPVHHLHHFCVFVITISDTNPGIFGCSHRRFSMTSSPVILLIVKLVLIYYSKLMLCWKVEKEIKETKTLELCTD